MVFEGRRRSSEGLRADVDLPFAGEDLTGRRAAPGRSRAAPVTFAPEATGEKTFHDSPQQAEWTPGWLPAYIDGEIQMSRAGTERLWEYMMQDLPEQAHDDPTTDIRRFAAAREPRTPSGLAVRSWPGPQLAGLPGRCKVQEATSDITQVRRRRRKIWC